MTNVVSTFHLLVTALIVVEKSLLHRAAINVNRIVAQMSTKMEINAEAHAQGKS